MRVNKVLITGGSGFIGSKAAAYLADRDYQVLCPSSQELNVLEAEDFRRWTDVGIGHVVHLAGKTFVPDSWEKPADFFMTNLAGTLNTVEFCRKAGISMTYVSAYIYGQPEKLPIDEEAPVCSNNPYAKSKYMAEELCEFFCRNYGMDISVLRLFNVFGSGQSNKFLIPYIIEQAVGPNKNITVQDLEPRRDYVYIDDVCSAIERSITGTMGFQLFNVGSGRSYSVRDVIQIVQEKACTNKEVVSKQNIRKNELNDVVADITAIRKAWNWCPHVSMEEGLQICVEAHKHLLERGNGL
ncbi:MAG: NAD(P)-dependent oxidoreductase [Butyrivibrio sp.]|nr:NAD(P)-dependent oxidoreductase [Ruminococcus flavefaciens]MCM1559164.1 NAD(P)-dependent oxidoreductase [Butyrivibrio sp.]